VAALNYEGFWGDNNMSKYKSESAAIAAIVKCPWGCGRNLVRRADGTIPAHWNTKEDHECLPPEVKVSAAPVRRRRVKA
jgi:hypothetical protein